MHTGAHGCVGRNQTTLSVFLLLSCSLPVCFFFFFFLLHVFMCTHMHAHAIVSVLVGGYRTTFVFLSCGSLGSNSGHQAYRWQLLPIEHSLPRFQWDLISQSRLCWLASSSRDPPLALRLQVTATIPDFFMWVLVVKLRSCTLPIELSF